MTVEAFNTATKTISLLGQRFGSLVITAYAGSRKNRAVWRCRCDCGQEAEYAGATLRKGNAKSCGCMQKGRPPRHGMSGTKTYAAWRGMHERCATNQKRVYPRYAGRGIQVCDRWASFDNFLADMGEAPPGLSLDRIDNDGNYEPGNCRWATLVEQCRNRSSNRMLEHEGVVRPLPEWAERFNLPRHALSQRIRAGWAVSDALTRPLRERREAWKLSGRDASATASSGSASGLA